MTLELHPQVVAAAASHPHPLLFATLSGAHLYGFASPDSDWDLRGCHVLPARVCLGLQLREETLTVARKEPGFELDLVTHDARKFFLLMLRPNGYVLEQVFSPHVVVGGQAFAELQDLARGCITRHHVHHYLGFYRTQRRLLDREDPPRIKTLLYTYRVLLTGIHLMRTGVVEANLERLNDAARLPQIPELILTKRHGAERTAGPIDRAFHEGELQRLEAALRAAATDSALPEAARARAGLEDLLLRLRESPPRFSG